MNVFWPEGFVPTQKAIVIAAEYWFVEDLAAITAAVTDRLAPENEPESGDSKAGASPVRAFYFRPRST